MLTPALPIDAVLPEIISALEKTVSAIVIAEPGAGKTTRVPLALLDTSWLGSGKILMLEPRRLAARTAAIRMANTLGEEIGKTVGYRVRMDAKVSKDTRIEVITEGVFTRLILDDPELNGIACVIFDEFHERSLDGDLGLALAIDARALREDLRILVMSATLDGAAVSTLLENAPIITCSGRNYPVETLYAPPVHGGYIEQDVTALTLRALKEQPGSALVFLPGQAEIRRTADALSQKLPPNILVTPLYGQLTAKEQDAAILPAPTGMRKIVLATSIAQTSLTIEGIRIVIDAGLSRVPVYDANAGVTRLETRNVTRAAADQRRGRAGRTEPGVCYRMWAEQQTAGLLPFDAPEITQTDLSKFALDLASWGVSSPRELSLLDQPNQGAWSEATTLLKRLNALDKNGIITPHGKQLAKLPLHPRLSHMLSIAAKEGDILDAALLAATLSEHGLGGRDVDIISRVQRVKHETSQRAKDVKALAQRWSLLFSEKSTHYKNADLSEYLARAYPDRVAIKSGANGSYKLANGRIAKLDQTEALAKSDALIVLDMTGTAANSFIRSAAPITRDKLEQIFTSQITNATTIFIDTASNSVRAKRERKLGEIVLETVQAKITDNEEAASLLAYHISLQSIGRLKWSKEQISLRARSTYLHSVIGNEWQDLSDQALALNNSKWLTPHIHGIFKRDDITAEHLGNALYTLLPWNLREEMTKLLPSHFHAPSGSSVPIDYESENGPILAIRVQELFGLDTHPSIANGKVSLLLSLLSPAHRPIQTTRDLPSFWRGSWREVAKDLKGRYPRHSWPEDPLSAAPTHRAKPRS